MILGFQILDLSLNKINFPFENFYPIFTQQHGKVGQNWHFANFAKSVEIWWFYGDITDKNCTPVRSKMCILSENLDTLL